MSRLVLFLSVAVLLFAGVGGFDAWIDPAGILWKPSAVADARKDGCLVSQELIGIRYYDFKRDVFAHRPTRAFVVGSSRVLKIEPHPGESSFANLGYPGSAPSTILKLLRSLPAKPVQTVYLGVEAFWLNKRYVVPDTDPSDYRIVENLLSRRTLEDAVRFSRQHNYILTDRWRRAVYGNACIIGRIYPSIAWALDGSRVWSWELDPVTFPKFHAAPFTGDLATWRNGYFDDWRTLDGGRLRSLEQVLALARERGWRVVGFAPPEPPHMLHVLETDPRVAPRWNEYLREMPRLFERYGFAWADVVDGRKLGCKASQFPDAFHSDAACSALVRERLDEAARRLH
jgi:hypothetical protein